MNRETEITVMTNKLRQVWLKYPELRLGQLMEVMLSKDRNDCCIFYVSDSNVLEIMKKWDEEQDGL